MNPIHQIYYNAAEKSFSESIQQLLQQFWAKLKSENSNTKNHPTQNQDETTFKMM
jgi:hypothetical protein